MAGAAYLSFSTTWEPDSGTEAESVYHPFYPPHLFVDSDVLGDRWRVGLGVHAPYGSGGRVWESDSSARYMSIENLISTIAINPTVAFKVNPSLAVGFGVSAMRADLRMKRAVDQSLFGATDATMENAADGVGYGWNAGVLWTVGDDLRLGATYRSKVRVELEGDLELKSIAPPAQPLFGGANYTTPMEGKLTFPDVINVGVAWLPTKTVTIASDIEWIQWSTMDVVRIDVKREVPEARFGDIAERLDWKDVWIAKIGAEWEAAKGVRLRTGYAYAQTYVPSSTLAAGNPEANQHNFSVGAGLERGFATLDVFYSLGIFEDRKVDNPLAKGEFENVAHYAGVSLTCSFGGK
jgi:long-chain fatty acid transport protein